MVLLLADVCDDPQMDRGSKLSSSSYYHSIYIYDQHLKEFEYSLYELRLLPPSARSGTHAISLSCTLENFKFNSYD